MWRTLVFVLKWHHHAIQQLKRYLFSSILIPTVSISTSFTYRQRLMKQWTKKIVFTKCFTTKSNPKTLQNTHHLVHITIILVYGMLHHCWCKSWWRGTADWRNRAHQGAIRFLRNLSSRTVRWRISSLITQFTRLKKTGAWINWHWFNTSRGGVVQWTIASRNLQWNWTVKQS